MQETMYPTEDLGPQIDKETIKRLEEHISSPLPNDYCDFLLRYNGGAFEEEPVFFMETAGDSSSLLSVFFGINDDGFYDIYKNINAYKDRLPPKLLPIAEDPGGNIVCLSYTENEFGRIYFWDHERETSPPNFSNCYKVAENFTQFMESLKPYDDDDDDDDES